ncbi:MAG: cyclodeaminase/cyclohydrolase family protein [Candidatus Omnitrophica bacterium]|nr:cyclodeaminase/cyclohydrolase family protein [Candidatus Omnitrophota bacterium]
MIRYKNSTLEQYLEQLAAREPVPGGGSAAALCGALGAGLLEMVTRYSLGKGKPPEVERELALLLEKAGQGRLRLLELVSHDSEAYLAMREAKKVGEAAYRQATERAVGVPVEIVRLCREMVQLAPYLHREGNPHLLSDVVAAEKFLEAGAAAAGAMIEANQ